MVTDKVWPRMPPEPDWPEVPLPEKMPGASDEAQLLARAHAWHLRAVQRYERAFWYSALAEARSRRAHRVLVLAYALFIWDAVSLLRFLGVL